MSTRMRLSPALRISMSYVYASAPVCGVLVIFYSAVHLAELAREGRTVVIGIMFLIMILMIFAGVPVAFSILGSGYFFFWKPA